MRIHKIESQFKAKENIMKHQSRYHDRRAARGFSLLELTLVILIIGVLMGVATVAFAPALFRGKTAATKASMTTIRRALEEYKGINNVYPPSIGLLAPNFLQSVPKDGWGNDFYYSVPGQGGQPYTLISAGDDGAYATADDIDVWMLDAPNP